MKTCVIGLGHLGISLCFFLAENGNTVTGFDIDSNKIHLLTTKNFPFIEKRSKELFKKHSGNKLLFVNSLEEGVKDAEIIFLCVNTPTGLDGSINVSYLDDLCEKLQAYLTHPVILVIKSTVPVGTGKKLQALFKETEVEVLSNPDFFDGEYALSDLHFSEKVVIGHNSLHHAKILSSLYKEKNIVLLDHTSAELAKYATQSALANRLSFINEISNISEYFGGNITKIKEVLSLDERISNPYLHSGLGFGGSSISKDILCLLYETKKRNIDTPLLSAIKKVNDERISIFLEKIKNELSIDNFKDLHLSIFGISSKDNIEHIKTSIGYILAELLLYKDIKLTIYDNLTKKYKGEILKKAIFYNSAIETLKNSDGLLILSSNKEYRELDFSKLCSKMNNKIIFDPLGLLSGMDMPSAIRYIGN